MFTSAPHFTFAFHHCLMFSVLYVDPYVHVCVSACDDLERERLCVNVCECVCACASLSVSATMYSHACASLE